MEELQRLVVQQQQALQQQQQQHQEEMVQMRAVVERVAAQTQQAVADVPALSLRQISSVVDPKLLNVLPKFSGKDEDFLEWEAKILSICSLLGDLEQR
eukprot:6397434-Amphidinium_carterae.1